MATGKPKPPRPRNRAPKPLSERLKEPVVIISIFVTILSLVVTGLLAVFNYNHSQQKENLEGRIKLLEKELEVVKQELAEKSKSTTAATKSNSSTETIGNGYQISIGKNQKASVPPDLSITIDDIVFKGEPPSYKVEAKVLYKDHPAMQITDGDVGYQGLFPKEGGYLIKIIEVGAVSATFAITKNSP